MVSEKSAFAPYGAFELKARYQHNMVIANMVTIGLLSAILLTCWVVDVLTVDPSIPVQLPPRIIESLIDLGRPPTIIHRPPEIRVDQPPTSRPAVGIPEPRPDEEIGDDGNLIATRDELAIINRQFDVDDIDPNGPPIVVNITDDELYLPPDSFVSVEIMAEFVHREQPIYPRLAKQAGITGVVAIQVLVDRDGSVRKVLVARSSGTASLDEAAVAAAWKNTFKPAVQNGLPVPVWVSYTVVFELR